MPQHAAPAALRGLLQDLLRPAAPPAPDPLPGQPLVRAVGLGKSYPTQYGQVQALRGLDLELAVGQYLAIMGASGSGKSTLLTLLGCLDRPSQGSYHLAGQDVASASDRELSRLRANHIGFIFQTFNLLPQLTVMENVALPYLYRQHSPELVRGQVSQALERVGLGHRLEHRPAQLSGGEMQRVAIARALAIKPWLILADEPTGNLDSKNSQAILALFQELNSQGVTLVVVTHDPQVAARARRTIELLDGCLVSDQENAP